MTIRTSNFSSRFSERAGWLAAAALAFAPLPAGAYGTLDYQTALGPGFWTNSIHISSYFPEKNPEESNPFIRKRITQDEQDEEYFEPEPVPSDVSYNLGYNVTRTNQSAVDGSGNVTNLSFFNHGFRGGLGWEASPSIDFGIGMMAETTPSQEYRSGGYDLAVGYMIIFNPDTFLKEREQRRRKRQKKAEIPWYRKHLKTFQNKQSRELNRRNEMLDSDDAWYLYVQVTWTAVNHVLQSTNREVGQRGLGLDLVLTPDPEYSVGVGFTTYRYNQDPDLFLSGLSLPGGVPAGIAGFSAAVQSLPDWSLGAFGSYSFSPVWSFEGALSVTSYPGTGRTTLVTFTPSVAHTLSLDWAMTLGGSFLFETGTTSVTGSLGVTYNL